MKQFNLEEYLENPNRKVVTREGAGVRIICTDRIRTYLDKDYPVVGLVRNRFDGSEMVASFKSNGKSKDKNWDLFFDPEQKSDIIDHKIATLERVSFTCGAKWMQSELIEKAVNWLQDHVNDYLFDDGTPERPWLKCKSEMFDDFKKAMEE